MGIVVRRIISKTALAALSTYAADDVMIIVATGDVFRFDAASSATHTGVDVIKPDDLLARKSGRWLRVKFKAEDLDGTDGMPTHAGAHENGGADEIDVTGLSGVLADPQPPIIGAGADEAVAGNDARLTDDRDPNAHKASHENGGGDEISVSGLSGVLADAQVADTIAETSGPTELAVGDVADGHLLKRVGATVVGLDPATIGGSGGLVTTLVPPPAIASWTALNSANGVDFDGGIYLAAAANGDVNNPAVKGYERALPGATFNVTIGLMAVHFVEPWLGYGIYLRDHVGGGIVAIGISIPAANRPASVDVAKYTNPTTFSANYGIGGQIALGVPKFLRFTIDGGNRVAQISADGQNWLTIQTIADNDFVVPTRWGWFVNAQHGTLPVAASLVHCVEESLD